MRIVSQLVPSGKPVSTDIEAMRTRGANMWEIPTWGHPLALGIYPLFLRNQLHLLPAGSAFCISNLGVSVTSLQNILAAARRHKIVYLPDREHGSDQVMDISMAVFHHQVLRDGSFLGNVCNLEVIQGASPTDVGYAFPQFESGFPYLPLPLSFALPEVGSRVLCVGYADFGAPGELPLKDIASGRVNLLHLYEHKLVAVEGRIARIHAQGAGDAFGGGPCFVIDAEAKDGMVGGPVFCEHGYVCGVVCGVRDGEVGRAETVASLLYPALGLGIRFRGRVGKVRVQANRRLVELIRQGGVVTDGTENIISNYEGTVRIFP